VNADYRARGLRMLSGSKDNHRRSADWAGSLLSAAEYFPSSASAAAVCIDASCETAHWISRSSLGSLLIFSALAKAFARSGSLVSARMRASANRISSSPSWVGLRRLIDFAIRR